MSRLFAYLEKIEKDKIRLKKTNGADGQINRLYYDNDEKGYLDFDQDDDTYFLIIVEVKPEYKNLGIATMLLTKFFEIVSENNGALDMSGFLEDGEKYLKSITEKLKNKYHNIVYLWGINVHTKRIFRRNKQQ